MPHSSVSRTILPPLLSLSLPRTTVPAVKHLTAVSTLKHVEDVPITFAVEELLQQHAPGTINQTADEDTDDWSLFAPRTPVSLPSLVSVTTPIDPTDEMPPIDEDNAPHISIISQIDPSPPHTDTTPILPLVTPDVPPMKESALPDQPRTSRRCATTLPVDCPLSSHAFTKCEREYNTDDESFSCSHKQLTRRSVPLSRSYIRRCPALRIPPFNNSSG
ncbi:hypothetical protein EDB92DRAFT_1958033 [Lactarius akahatsu]|uniref:Uncharacterized protein n=1 Tax=Lactarius akahatsu TaxID=416441 RepID=A0AAD4L4E9_9AGAM|nr:hypothetical protein EDB92DRAFT_1958033 [Lactarius akahatsu]